MNTLNVSKFVHDGTKIKIQDISNKVKKIYRYGMIHFLSY